MTQNPTNMLSEHNNINYCVTTVLISLSYKDRCMYFIFPQQLGGRRASQHSARAAHRHQRTQVVGASAGRGSTVPGLGDATHLCRLCSRHSGHLVLPYPFEAETWLHMSHDQHRLRLRQIRCDKLGETAARTAGLVVWVIKLCEKNIIKYLVDLADKSKRISTRIWCRRSQCWS